MGCMHACMEWMATQTGGGGRETGKEVTHPSRDDVAHDESDETDGDDHEITPVHHHPGVCVVIVRPMVHFVIPEFIPSIHSDPEHQLDRIPPHERTQEIIQILLHRVGTIERRAPDIRHDCEQLEESEAPPLQEPMLDGFPKPGEEGRRTLDLHETVEGNLFDAVSPRESRIMNHGRGKEEIPTTRRGKKG